MLYPLFVLRFVLPNPEYSVVLLNDFLGFLQAVSEIQMHDIGESSYQAVEN